jgi:hypothetical protein
MNIQNPLITLRDSLMNRILRVNSNETLNSISVVKSDFKDGSLLANEIKNSLNQIKSLAVTADGSQVDFKKLSGNPIYRSYRDLVGHLMEFDYRSLENNKKQLTFWINLYNALVIDAVIQFEVKSSVTESWLGILAFFEKAAYIINGQRFSLSDIEHGVLRSNSGFPYIPGPHFSSRDPRINAVIPELDPRIHFALNCASKSCPPIGIYSAENLDQQLDLATKSFINNDLKIQVEKKTLSVSRIFQWYGNDFGGKQALPGYLLPYINNPENKTWLEENYERLRINFHSYDWGLNKISS